MVKSTKLERGGPINSYLATTDEQFKLIWHEPLREVGVLRDRVKALLESFELWHEVCTRRGQ